MDGHKPVVENCKISGKMPDVMEIFQHFVKLFCKKLR